MKKTAKALNILVFLLLPIYLIRIQLFENVSINLLDILLLTTILSNFYLVKKEKIFALLKENRLIFTFVFLILLSFHLSYVQNCFEIENWTGGLGALKSFLFLPIFYVFSLILVLKEKTIPSFFTNHVLISYFILSSFLGFLGYFYCLKNALTFDGRLKLFFDSPNSLAMLLVIGILIGFYLLFFKKKHFPILISVSTGFQLFGLFKTYSLGAWIGLFLATIFWIFAKKTKPLVFFAILGSFLIILLTNHNSQFINHDSNSSRLAIYQVSQKILRNNWLIGIGPGNFQQKYLEFQKFFPPYPQWAVPHAHNNLLHFWIEGGILAFGGLLALIFLTFYKRKSFSSEEQEKLMVIVLVYFFIHGSIDTTIWKNDLAVLFYFFAIATNLKPNSVESSSFSINEK